MAFKELPVQYADFACWQRRWLSGPVIQEMLDYWKPQLAEIPRLELPADRPHAATPSFRGTSERIFLGRDTLAAINRLARDEGATLFMALLAAFQVLLQRYTGQDDIAVGSPIANRNRIEIEGIVGFFVNSLVLRADLSGDPTFREALRRVREITLKAYEFQDMPFEKLVEHLTPERNFGQNPFFQIMFALQNLPPRQPLEVEGLRMSQIISRPAATRFEIEVHLWEALEGLEGLLVYNPDRFDASRIARMVEHYGRILQAVSSKPDRKLSDLPILSSEERERQLFEWNQTAAPYPRERCIPYVAPRNTIEEQVAAIWSRLLIVERVGVHDNFFELGGHSLKLLNLLDVLEKQTGLWLRVIDVLENPTVAGMAAKLQLSSRLNGSPIIIENFLVRLRAGGQKPLFIIPGGWGGENEMLVFSSMLPFLEKDMPVYGIFSRALDEAWPLPRDLRAQTTAVLKAIRHVEPHGPYIILGACIASPQAVEVAIQAEREGERPGSVILLDAAAPSRPPHC
jgi:Condensation domain/Phosphopantetheine attachment site